MVCFSVIVAFYAGVFRGSRVSSLPKNVQKWLFHTEMVIYLIW